MTDFVDTNPAITFFIILGAVIVLSDFASAWGARKGGSDEY